jgi:hypothetical protein
VLEDAPRASPRPRPSPSPIPGDEWVAVWLPGEGKWAETQTHWAGRRSVGDAPRVPLDLTFMEAVDDWTPRMKREYLRELKRERERYPHLPSGPSTYSRLARL